MSKCFQFSFQYFRKPNQPRRPAEPLPRCSQTLTLGRFRVVLEIQLRYFNLVWWFPICLEVGDHRWPASSQISENLIEWYFWPSLSRVSNKLIVTIMIIFFFFKQIEKSFRKWKYFWILSIDLNSMQNFKKCKLLSISLFYFILKKIQDPTYW